MARVNVLGVCVWFYSSFSHLRFVASCILNWSVPQPTVSRTIIVMVFLQMRECASDQAVFWGAYDRPVERMTISETLETLDATVAFKQLYLIV